MRPRPLALAVALSLGACSLFGGGGGGGGSGGGGGAGPVTPAEAACRDAAYDDPAVKAIIIRRTSGDDAASRELLPDEQEAVRQATLRCLRNKGLAPLGGVEKVQHPR